MASIGINPHGKGALPKKAPPPKPRAPKKIPPKSEWRRSSRKRPRSAAEDDLPAAVAETRRTHPHTLSQTRSDLGEALQDATASTLRVGERVRAAWRKGRDYYAGKIISVHEAARTCTVAYDDDRSIKKRRSRSTWSGARHHRSRWPLAPRSKPTGTASATGTRRPSPRGTPTGPTTSRTSTTMIPK